MHPQSQTTNRTRLFPHLLGLRILSRYIHWAIYQAYPRPALAWWFLQVLLLPSIAQTHPRIRTINRTHPFPRWRELHTLPRYTHWAVFQTYPIQGQDLWFLPALLLPSISQNLLQTGTAGKMHPAPQDLMPGSPPRTMYQLSLVRPWLSHPVCPQEPYQLLFPIQKLTVATTVTLLPESELLFLMTSLYMYPLTIRWNQCSIISPCKRYPGYRPCPPHPAMHFRSG